MRNPGYGPLRSTCSVQLIPGTKARGTFAPILTNDAVVHLGVSYTTRDADVRADEVDSYNLELAGCMDGEEANGKSGDEVRARFQYAF